MTKMAAMFAKVKSSVFIDALHLELSLPRGHSLSGTLKDDHGSVCRTMERKVYREKEEMIWDGLNDLPYGRYTLELRQGEDEIRLDLVKRI